MSRVGVMALQGGYGAHLKVLSELGHHAIQVRTTEDFSDLNGLVLPGGESTTQLKLIERHGLEDALNRFAGSGKPVLATCAGLILAARAVRQPSQRSFGWLDVAVNRNAWGRQIDSFEAETEAQLGTAFGEQLVPLVFIRAPRIVEVGPKTEILVSFRREPVLVQEGNIYGATFHPELTRDCRVHALIFGSQPTSRSANHGTETDADRNDDHPRWRTIPANCWRGEHADFSVVDVHLRR